jgi:hypothetical protein
LSSLSIDLVVTSPSLAVDAMETSEITKEEKVLE